MASPGLRSLVLSVLAGLSVICTYGCREDDAAAHRRAEDTACGEEQRMPSPASGDDGQVNRPKSSADMGDTVGGAGGGPNVHDGGTQTLSDREQIILEAFKYGIFIHRRKGGKVVLAMAEGSPVFDLDDPRFPDTFFDPSDAVVKALRQGIGDVEVITYSTTGLPSAWDSLHTLRKDETLLYVESIEQLGEGRVRVAIGHRRGLSRGSFGGHVLTVVKKGGHWRRIETGWSWSVS